MLVRTYVQTFFIRRNDFPIQTVVERILIPRIHSTKTSFLPKATFLEQRYVTHVRVRSYAQMSQLASLFIRGWIQTNVLKMFRLSSIHECVNLALVIILASWLIFFSVYRRAGHAFLCVFASSIRLSACNHD